MSDGVSTNDRPSNWSQAVSLLASRRFLLCVGCSGVNSLLLWYGKLSEAGYLQIILATVAAYIAGNTVQKIVEMRTTGLPAGTPVAAPVRPGQTATVIEAEAHPK